MKTEIIHGNKKSYFVQGKTYFTAVNKARRIAKEHGDTLAGGSTTIKTLADIENAWVNDGGLVYVPKGTRQLYPPKGRPAHRITLAEYSSGDHACDIENCEDTYCYDLAWDAFCDDISKYVMRGKEFFRDDAKDMGWMRRSGYRVFRADNAMEFLRAISPDTHCAYRFHPGKHGRGVIARISHHDAPMGENHYIRAISERTYKTEEQN